MSYSTPRSHASVSNDQAPMRSDDTYQCTHMGAVAAIIAKRPALRAVVKSAPVGAPLAGDTLSPFLFLIYLEPLLRWLNVGGRGHTFDCIPSEKSNQLRSFSSLLRRPVSRDGVFGRRLVYPGCYPCLHVTIVPTHAGPLAASKMLPTAMSSQRRHVKPSRKVEWKSRRTR